MSETVVTVQDGAPNNANNPRQTPTVKTEPGQPSFLSGITLNVPYFKSIPGILKLVQLVRFYMKFTCIFMISQCLLKTDENGEKWLLGKIGSLIFMFTFFTLSPPLIELVRATFLMVPGDAVWQFVEDAR